MIQESLPRKFWGECILTATHIINRLPTSILNWKTPYEVLHGYQIIADLKSLEVCVLSPIIYHTRTNLQKEHTSAYS